MKIKISQEILVHAIERGAVAALSDEAAQDNSNVSMLIQSLKITAKKEKIVFESTTNVLSSKYELKVDLNNGVEVQEEGVVLVQAKPLHQWLNTQKKSTIGLRLKSFETSKSINSSEDIEQQDGNVIQIVGDLLLTSKDENGTGDKWKLDCYDENQVTMTSFEDKKDIHVSIPVSELDKATKLIKISLLPKDWNHIYDSFVLEKIDGKVVLASTDCARCSVYELETADLIDDSFFDKSRVFVNGNHLLSILKLASSTETANIFFDSKENKCYVQLSNLFFRISSPDKDQREKFPKLETLLKTKYIDVGSMDKNPLQKRISAASIVNSDSIQFVFEGGKDKAKVNSISETGKAPTSGLTSVENCSKDLKAVFSVKHLNEFIKTIGGDNLSLKVMENGGNVFVFCDDSVPNSRMYTMKKDSSIYS